MSVDMNSQGSDSNEEDYDPNCEEEEEDEDPGDIEDYYVGVASDVEQQGPTPSILRNTSSPA